MIHYKQLRKIIYERWEKSELSWDVKSQQVLFDQSRIITVKYFGKIFK